MRIDLVKRNLKGVALISECFKDKFSESDLEEIKEFKILRRMVLLLILMKENS